MGEPKPAFRALDELANLAPEAGLNLRVFPSDDPPPAAPAAEPERRARAGRPGQWLAGLAGAARREGGRHRRPDPGEAR